MKREKRESWPRPGSVVSARQHPLLPILGPLLLPGTTSFKAVTPDSCPLKIDADAARVAAYLAFSFIEPVGQPPTRPALPSEYFVTLGLAPDADKAAAQAFWEARAENAAHVAESRAPRCRRSTHTHR